MPKSPAAAPPDPPTVPALLNEFVANLADEFEVHQAALTFRQALEHDHPATWRAYTEHHWAAHFEDLIRRRLGEVRAAARQSQTRSVARSRVSEKVLTGMAQTSYAVDNSGKYRKLLAMSKADLLNVANRYEASASTSMKQCAFLRVLAKKVKAGQVVGDAWSLPNIERQARTIFGAQADDFLDGLDGAA